MWGWDLPSEKVNALPRLDSAVICFPAMKNPLIVYKYINPIIIMNLCYSRYCVSNFPGTKPPLTKPKYACPYCKTALYCSQKCRELDW